MFCRDLLRRRSRPSEVADFADQDLIELWRVSGAITDEGFEAQPRLLL
jgi:hypothetical protein